MARTKIFALLSLAVLPFVIIVMLGTYRVASDAARRTPDAPNFREFAQPGSTKFEGKASYLYAPFAIQCLGVDVWVYWFVNRKKICAQKQAHLLPVAWLAWTFALSIGGQAQATHALSAAGQPAMSDRVESGGGPD